MLVRTRDEGDRVLVFQRKQNNRGYFVEISVTPRFNKGCRIIIPKDVHAVGWENFANILQREYLRIG